MKELRWNQEKSALLKKERGVSFDELVSGKELRAVADAVAARKKDMTLTIRVNSKDINRIKKLAQTKGIPYQSYLSEVIHRVAAAV